MTTALYLEDAYKTSCETEVIKVEGNKVFLKETVFYPTGGGQECDTGVIVQDGSVFEVEKVKKEQGEIVHYIKDEAQVKLGPVKLEMNWERRHHSLLHLIGAVVYEKYGALCTGNQIYPDKARIDFNELQELSSVEVEEIVEEVNKLIEQNKEISTRYMSREEAENAVGMIKTAINLLPTTIQEIRIVTIENLDEQACGGTHVKNTSEIGTLVIDKVKSKGKQNRRFEVRAI
ncbi:MULTISPECIES: alanyl-tRNA editing protein [Bacillus]|uniref:alanyl-tRNA editing protein n=1 Tax=Bacillus TaxID=1386 RepID=UPI000917EA28|nr:MULTISPECIES: alanyl-tRNA editing protein [Bacillus]MED3269667.1 alanyl-tRNA editing protein [Bacillus thuringiensis]PFA81755.1 alanyl-tRNA editing protein [Bacillus thuringiensis]PFB48935.1 alanyl-tRNA editing protein [Bacillus thuringiensis]PFE91590.1 alanyl-tRNA editing protein [Bacillus thuringiensis]PFV43653.1 alanyl-tRNA editing protein [Bacillus thuringiensis]